MYKLTNKELLATKNERFDYTTFDENGLRCGSYGNIDIVTANREVLRDTLKGLDVLLLPYDEKNSIKIITTLEGALKRRATKKEVIDFVNNNYKLKGVNPRFEEIINKGRGMITSSELDEIRQMEDVEVEEHGIVNEIFGYYGYTFKTKYGNFKFKREGRS